MEDGDTGELAHGWLNAWVFISGASVTLKQKGIREGHNTLFQPVASFRSFWHEPKSMERNYALIWCFVAQ
jgi:hypothetical protein